MDLIRNIQAHGFTSLYQTTVLFLLTLVIVPYLWRKSSSTGLKARGLPLPPGPPRKWITGNLHQLPVTAPKEHVWLQVIEWSKTYGPIVYVQLPRKRIIFLDSAKVVSDLMDSRSSKYSDRPRLIMEELAGRDSTMFSTSFAHPRFKILRRLLQDGLNSRAVKSYRPILGLENMVLLKNLVEFPNDFCAHIRRNAVASIIKIAYGYQVKDDDPIVLMIEEAMAIAGTLMAPGRFLVEFLPFLRFVPSWFPGAGFKRYARIAKDKIGRLDNMPFDFAKAEILSGDYIESFTSKHLVEDNGLLGDPQKQEYIKWASSALYFGGGDTTVSALTTFFLVMALHPGVQRKAQADIDQIAPNRLPTLDDYDSLPYIKAIIKEIVRWGVVVPLGLPHRVMEDDVYENYFIPKGATVIGNIWAIAHDDEAYPDPLQFDPNRHLGENPQLDPFKFIFGFGRRACPGVHLAEASMFLNIACILAVFNISKPVDGEGREVDPGIEWNPNGITSHLKPFDCQIKPRSGERLALVSEVSLE